MSAVTLTSSVDIARYQLLVLRGAVKMEAFGMKKHGRSATMTARLMFNLPVGVSREVIIEHLNEAIKEFE